ncbi:hypothetical protein DL93DRAFT_1584990 [Clavulina sp. PMI_390]|nr:hypothetical protein DL93DRAFT_1584990 [Clavulina sp. PMI_390]
MLGTDTLAFAPEVPKDVTIDVFEKEERELSVVTVEDVAKPVGKWRGQSMYPKLLQELIATVLEYESFLFDETECNHLQHLRSLDYGPRYLFVRLALRRRSKVHRLSDLLAKYSEELGDEIPSHINSLCSKSPPIADIQANSSEPEAGPCPPQDKYPELYAHDEGNISTEDILGALKGDEIKNLATKLKVAKPKMTRAELIQALLSGASKQATLAFFVLPTPKKIPDERPKTPPPLSSGPIVIDLVSPPPIQKTRPAPQLNQTNRLRQLILGVEKKFVRISDHMFDLLQRVNLVFFRSTEYESNSILLPLILSRSKKRKYPDYPTTRTIEVFSSREHLLAYEQALKLEYDIEAVLGEGERSERGEKAYQLFESIYGRWQSLVAELKDNGEEGAYARPGLERFEEGHVLTRIVCKGADALATLHRYDDEVKLLRELLSQKRWRKGKRGLWYDRLALVLMQHLSEPEQAMQVVIDALNDDLTHIVIRPRLIRRLARLEKRLKVPEDERHESERELKKCEAITIEGRRVHHMRAPSLTPITSFFNVQGGDPRSRSPSLSRSNSDPIKQKMKGQVGTHSLWRSTIGEGEEIGVEEVALEHYATLGFKGLHSEGRVVRHIFLLLFWEIIFLPVEGAFETAYQMAPLDISHDSFYFARKKEIDTRLKEIEDGEASRIARETDQRERKLNTFAIGAAWDLCTKEETLEIIECFDGKALALICKVICEDYTHRASGVPDLLIWNHSTQSVKFVEVKGPGDTLMENQKVWIDAMLEAGIEVEVCHVREEGSEEVVVKSGKSRTGALIKKIEKTKAKNKAQKEKDAQAEGQDASPAPEEEQNKSGKGKRKTKAKAPAKAQTEDQDLESEDEVVIVDAPATETPAPPSPGPESKPATPAPQTPTPTFKNMSTVSSKKKKALIKYELIKEDDPRYDEIHYAGEYTPSNKRARSSSTTSRGASSTVPNPKRARSSL